MRSLFMVFSNPVPAKETAYNEWYDNQHLPDLLRVPGIAAARRYELSNAQLSTDGHPPSRYLAIYEIDAEDPAQVLSEIRIRSGTDQMPLSDALDLKSVTTLCYTERRTANEPEKS